MFIGRERELKFLEDKYTEKKGQLIVLYGRRRVGKTETLREFCKDKPHIFFSCTQTTGRVQLAKFSARILKEDIPARQYVSEFADWEKAFRAILDLPYGDRKKLIVIDEFPYMCRGDKSIPSILQNLWDTAFKDSNVMIILCGSAMSFMEKELLAEKNPLYGRATGIYKMNKMGFYDAARFFPGYSARDKVLTYAVLGGIPHYLNQFSPELSVEENIKRNILTKGSVLYSEVDFLLHQELRETPIYNSIIEAVALGNTRLNDISQKSLVENTSKTSVYLKNLMELGIVEREFSVDAGEKEKANTARGTYRLTDNFFRFWYAFGFANLSQLEDGDTDGVYEYLVGPALHEFASLAFEDVCREYVRELQKKNELPFRYAKMGRWTGKTTTVRGREAENRIAETEIDILAISRGAKEYLVGECKFKGSAFSYSEYLDTAAKLAPLREKAKFYYALFSESGFDDRIIAEAQTKEELSLFDLETIVNLNR
ncbi:MAG TPA: ATP-binding protein [Candidatus Egerieimonas intestinavium]|uniref:ATP-binding protein n=1 Tax=Candidatus Egerieimonas intestinavium TaxID=2840777 RepID=A0A9D1EJC2_9FIRM|nr:ATP-binding protein [Candidatus Egerieimonas intestinavium]